MGEIDAYIGTKKETKLADDFFYQELLAFKLGDLYDAMAYVYKEIVENCKSHWT